MTFSRFVRLALGLVVLGLAPSSLRAQQEPAKSGTGRIVGRIVESMQGQPLAGAQVELVAGSIEGAASTIRVVSALDGRYTLQGVPAGTVSVTVRMIGYQPKTVTGIAVKAGAVVGQDIALSAQVIQLQEIAVTAEAERGSVNKALDEQRNATNIVSAIAAEQIQKSPDRDAAQAVQRVSGVTVQDGKYVAVRGLGERYTTTSLNGARVPSPDPERRVVPLDLFPSALLEGITTSKTFTADQNGDFAGAQVDLKTKEFPLRRTVTFTTSAGLNTSATGRTMLKAPTTGSEWLGLAGGDRQLPSGIRGLDNLNNASTGQINALVASFRNAWSPSAANGNPNGSFGLSIGGEDPLFKQPIGYIASLTYNATQEIRKDEYRALPAVSGGELIARNERVGETGRIGLNWGGILNLSTRIGSHTKVSLNNSLTRSADNEANQLSGHIEEFSSIFQTTRLTFTTNVVRSNQLSAEHLLGQRHFIDWSVTNSRVRRYEPDRSDLAYVAEENGNGEITPVGWVGGVRSATRTFGDLVETNWNGAFNYRTTFGNIEQPVTVKIGGLIRSTDRTADSRAYDIVNAPVGGLTTQERALPADVIFDGAFAAQSKLTLQFNNNGGRYDATDRLSAGYVQLGFPMGDRLNVIAGVRVEHDKLIVNSIDPLGQDTTAHLNNTDVLPAVALNFALRDDQTIRFSVSQTLARPEYRELSPVEAFEPIGGVTLFGNTNLRRSLVQNVDIRWEWYPSSGEVVSVAGFYKHFNNPIERVLVSGQGLDYTTFVNARGATDYGVELELRKRLGFLASGLTPFTLFTNATLMRSQVTPGESDEFALNDKKRQLVGQANYVVNTGLTFAPGDGAFSSTLLYNVVGKRISEAATVGLPNPTEMPRHLIDLSVQAPVIARLTAKFDARNLLDTPVKIEQGPITRLRYKTGRVFSMGLRWDL